MTTYFRLDGAPAGDFTVTVTKAEGFDEEGEPLKNMLPQGYGTPARSPLKVIVGQGTNDLRLEMTSK